MKIVFVLLFWFISTLAFAAPPLPFEQWQRETKLTLARTLVAEADWSRPDHAAIAHVLVKRWRLARRGQLPEVTFDAFVQRYSALWVSDSGRARAIRELPWAALPGPARKGSRWGGARWDRVRVFVEKWGRGQILDPCPRALHWGGTMDAPRGYWTPVSCGDTRNIFYAVDRKTSERG